MATTIDYINIFILIMIASSTLLLASPICGDVLWDIYGSPDLDSCRALPLVLESRDRKYHLFALLEITKPPNYIATAAWRNRIQLPTLEKRPQPNRKSQDRIVVNIIELSLVSILEGCILGIFPLRRDNVILDHQAYYYEIGRDAEEVFRDCVARQPPAKGVGGHIITGIIVTKFAFVISRLTKA